MSRSQRVGQVADPAKRAVISVGVDGSPAGDAALGWALDEAALRHSSVAAVTVWPYPYAGMDGVVIPVFPDMGAGPVAPDEPAGALARVGYRNQVPVESELRYGFPGFVLTDESRARDAELVVIGRPSGNALHDLLVGSAGHVVCHEAERPVVVVPPATGPRPVATDPYGVLAVGVDGSPRARAGLEWALAEAVLRGSAVRAVMAWDYVGRVTAPGAVLVAVNTDPDTERQAALLLNAEVRAARRAVSKAAAVPVTAVAVRGAAVPVLLRESLVADLLVIGDHRRTTLGEVALGSTTRSCLRQSAAPLVVVANT